MISTVPVIFASSFWLLAFEAVKETARIVTLFVAVPVLEEIPAKNISGAVNPGLFPVEGAVSAVPLALVVVALTITNLIPRMFRTLGVRTLMVPGYCGRRFAVFAVPSREMRRTEADVLKRV